MPKKSLIFLAAALLAIAAPAFAATTTEIKDFNGISNFSRNLTFNKFNNNGGLYSLNSIEVSLYLQTNGGRIIIDNDSPDSAIGTFEFGANAGFGSSDVSLGSIPNQIQAHNLLSINLGSNTGDDTNDYSPLPPDGNEYNGGTIYDLKSGFIDDPLLGQYLGTDTYDIYCQVYLWSNYAGTGDIEYFINTPVNVSGHVTITYDYTVPEPATIALLGIGFFAVIKINRKRGRCYPP